MLHEPDAGGGTAVAADAAGSAGTGLAAGAALDADQCAVLDVPAGRHTAVFGAPGTGKTTTLVEFVADRCAAGLAPERMLVLAASRQTATALRDAIAVRLGTTTLGPLARTANSIAFQLVRGLEGEDTRLLTGAEHDRLIDELLRGAIDEGGGPAWPDRLGPEVRGLRGFRSELRDLAMRAAEHGIRPADLAHLASLADRPEWAAAAGFLVEYEDVKDLAKARRFDSAELLAYAAAIVRRRDAEAEAALGPLAGLEVLLVDDAQEQTTGVAELLAGFAARGVQIIAFGDPDVAANGFRGGRAELLGSLGRVLGAPAERLELGTAHRGRPQIREVLAGVTEHVGAALGGRHRGAVLSPSAAEEAAADPVPPVIGIEAASHGAEVAQLAELLREHHLLGGVPWSRMAVVLRSGGDVPGFERGLALAEVPTAVSIAGQALRDAPAAAALLRAASLAIGRERLRSELAVDLLTGPIGGLDAVGLRRLRLALRQQELASGGDRPGDELLVDALGAPGGFETVDAHPARRAGRLAKTLDAARTVAARGGTVEEVLWAIWSGSGLAAEWGAQSAGTGVLADEANRGLDAAVALFAAAQRFVELTPEAPPGRFLDDLLGADVPEDTLAPRAAGDAVLVATPAALIGREFDVVVIAGLQDGTWPNLRPRGTLLHTELLARTAAAVRAGEAPPAPDDARSARQAVLGDELRLFALAVSRARRQLVLSCTANDDEQPSKLFGYARERRRGGRRRPLQLRGLVGALRAELATTPAGPAAAEAASALALLAEQGVPGAHPEEWYGLAEPSTERPLVDLDGDPEARVAVSPSQIERAEESPLGWFVDRVASPPSGIAASIGTIVHAVVEELGTRDDADTSVEAVWSEVARRLESVPFEAGWVAERERRGARRMAEGASAYLEAFADDGKVLIGAEGRFTLETGRVRITGTIDRVERSADGTVVIVDLKTGKTPPAQNRMKEHAQLGAYQLAARAGAVAGRTDAEVAPIGPDTVIGGAKLVFVARPLTNVAYTERAQAPFDEEEAAAFAERLDAVGRLMAAATFDSPADLGFNSPFGAWHYRVQLVPAVSA